jgi:hypothetical protein
MPAVHPQILTSPRRSPKHSDAEHTTGAGTVEGGSDRCAHDGLHPIEVRSNQGTVQVDHALPDNPVQELSPSAHAAVDLKASSLVSVFSPGG